MNQIKLRGHQRAGNHYLANLIELNLYDSTDSQRHHDPSGHLMPHQCFDDLNNLDILNVFIHRNFEDTLGSIYRMRHRFCLKGTKEEFETSLLSDLFYPEETKCDVEVNWYFKDKERLTDPSVSFGMFRNWTLRTWHLKFVSSWVSQAYRMNVYVCRYETLITKFGRATIIKDIAALLHQPCPSVIKNIEERVGYYEKVDDSWR